MLSTHNICVFCTIPQTNNCYSTNKQLLFLSVISGFHSEVAENCALLGSYAASSGIFLRTFRDNLTFLSSGFKNPNKSPQPNYLARCAPILHVVFLPYNSAGLQLPPSTICFRLSFINLSLSFLPSTSLVSVLLCLASHKSEFLLSLSVSIQLHWLPHSPPSNHLQQPYWLTPHYWNISPPTLFHVYTPFWGYRLSFGFSSP
jgi:hypothetical protein